MNFTIIFWAQTDNFHKSRINHRRKYYNVSDKEQIKQKTNLYFSRQSNFTDEFFENKLTLFVARIVRRN